MLASVDLHNQPSVEANKVDDVCPDRFLPLEFMPA
jgi:hypothetical protein